MGVPREDPEPALERDGAVLQVERRRRRRAARATAVVGVGLRLRRRLLVEDGLHARRAEALEHEIVVPHDQDLVRA